MTEGECTSRYFQSQSNTTDQEALNTSGLSQGSSDGLSLSQLTIREPEALHVAPYFNITPRAMPQSPHYILEEEFSSNPWAILVATVFLNKTVGKAARPFMAAFFERYPTPYDVLDASPADLEHYFDELGLRKRAHVIWRLSHQFVSGGWRRASDLCGIGKYGEDAYRIFCLGHTDVDPGDRYLRLYLDWLRCNTDFLEENGVVGCECFVGDSVLEYYTIPLRDYN